MPKTKKRRVKLGAIEFHSPTYNPGLIERFYAVVKDLRDAGCIVDLWLMDIAAVLKEFGYEMIIYDTNDRKMPLEFYRELQAKLRTAKSIEDMKHQAEYRINGNQ